MFRYLLIRIFFFFYILSQNLDSKTSTYTSGEYRYFETNSLPDHETGAFPNRNNPHRIQEKNKTYRVPLYPKKNASPINIGMNAFGVALNGILFDPSGAEFWNRDKESGWQYEVLSGKLQLGTDQSNAHVQPDGSYHYHGLPNKLYQSRKKNALMTLLGFAADGFPIYGIYGRDNNNQLIKLQPSWQLKQGKRPSNSPKGIYDGTFVEDYEFISGSGDLDESNGIHGITPEFPKGTYYYLITDKFPFIPRFWYGNADPSFKKKFKNMHDRRKKKNSGLGKLPQKHKKNRPHPSHKSPISHPHF